MRISRKETIDNIPILKIRDFFVDLRRNGTNNFTLKEVCNYFEIKELEADSLLRDLSDQEFIESCADCYKTTLKGDALCIARCVPPIDRIKADKIFNDFMQRVEEINSSDYYLYRVSKILLFGSYIKEDAVDFGDIDIAYELERKIKDADRFKKLDKEFVVKAKDEGKRFSSYIEELFYSETVVIVKLKNRNRYISLHEMNDDILDITESKQVYGVVGE